MRVIRRIDLKFTDKQMEAEYKALRRQNIMKDFQAVVGVIILILLTNGIDKATKQELHGVWLPFGMIIGLLIVFCVRKIFGKYIEILTVIVILMYTIYKLLALVEDYDSYVKGSLFTGGYVYGVLQAIVLSRISNMYYKIFAVLIEYALRIFLIVFLVDPATLQYGPWIRNAIVDAFTIYHFYISHKYERRIFQNFHENREEIGKFKELVAKYLPQSITLLDCQTAKSLFANQTFMTNFDNTIKDPYPPESPDTLLTQPVEIDAISYKPHFSSLYVDKMTIREAGTPSNPSAPLNFPDDVLQLSEVIKMVLKNNLLDEKALSLTASYSTQKEQKLFEVILKKIKWDKKDAAAVILNDITYQENLLALKMANVNKDKVIATVSHELRTPLHGIIGILNMTAKEVKETKALEYLSLCKDNAHLLLNLVNSLLDYQQISTGKLKLDPTKISLSKVLNDVAQLFQFQAREKNLSLEYGLENCLEPYIITDENRLKQVLINLIANAVKFTKEGGVKIIATQDKDEIEYIRISVMDTGIGIREQEMVNLFKMCGKVEGSASVNKNGIGLGLTISNALAFILNGNSGEKGIEVESQYNVGSSFSFRVLKDLNFYNGFTLTRRDNSIPTIPQELTPSCNRPSVGRMRSEAFEIQEDEQTYFQEFMGIANEYRSEGLQPLDIGSKLAIYAPRNRSNTMAPISSDIKIQVDSKNKESLNFSETGYDSEGRKIRNKRKYSSLKLLKGRSHISLQQIPDRGYVLVVDDNPFNLLVAGNLIKELGYTVKVALGGQEALEIVKSSNKEKEAIRAIFMDCQMPVMDGYETTRILESMMSHGEIERVPILAWTANNSEEDIQRCFECGMVGYVTKPTSQEALKKVLKNLE